MAWKRVVVTTLISLLVFMVTSPANAVQRGLPDTLEYEFVDCTAVRLYAANLEFIVRCHKVGGGVLSLPVAHTYDYTGKYAVGHDAQALAGINDAWRTQNISQVVTAFYQAKLNPDFAGLLRLRIFNSLLPSVETYVVDAAEIIEPAS